MAKVVFAEILGTELSEKVQRSANGIFAESHRMENLGKRLALGRKTIFAKRYKMEALEKQKNDRHIMSHATGVRSSSDGRREA